ncbi:MAG: twin-arginine translocation signal domain-containing protein, partial [Verrucomicrobiia bacterium]
MMTRREFLKQSAIGAATVWAAGCATGSSRSAGKIPIGLQLYSLRKEAAKDLEGVIAAVGKMGYKGVEFAGYHNRDAKTLRKLL